MTLNRRRCWYLIFAAVVMVLGLASRRYAELLPELVALYMGDALWALLTHLVAALAAPRQSVLRIALAVWLFTWSIELSQRYHAPWIDSIRETRVGGLVLGSGFLWTDLVCYSVGIAVGVAADAFWLRPRMRAAK